MRRPGIAFPVLALLLALNSWSGLAKVLSFWHRYQADQALPLADLDGAYAHLAAALSWYPQDPVSNIQRTRVIQQALANGLPLKDLEGRNTQEIFGVGLVSATRGIALNPSDAWGWFNLASLYQGYRASHVRLARMRAAGLKQGVPAAPDDYLDESDRLSIAAAWMAVRTEPAFFFYRDFLAKLYWDRGRKEDAAREVAASMELTPRLAAHTLLNEDDIVEGLAEPLLKGIEASRENPFVGPVMMERARAELLYRLGRFAEAIASYEELRRLGGAPLAQECDLALGKLEQHSGRWKESVPILERAHALGPSTRLGELALYYLGLAHEEMGSYADAAEFFERYLASAQGSLAGFHALARVRAALGAKEDARRLYVAAVRRFPDSAEAYWRVIDHLGGEGDYRQALLYAEALKRLTPGDAKVEETVRTLTIKAGSKRRP